MARLDAAFVVLGTGEPRYQDMWRSFAASHPTRIGARIGFDESLAHLIEAGADIFLMPSQFEPCGLNQMYSHALRDGAGRPRGRRLADTVVDYSPRHEQSTGFVMAGYTPRGAARGDASRACSVPRPAPVANASSWPECNRIFVGPFSAGVRQNIRTRSGGGWG